MHFFPKALILAAVSLLGAQMAVCDPLYSFGSVNKTYSDSPVTLGFVFTANTSFDVSALGWFDASGAGFQSQHIVGIYDASGTLLTSTTLSAGTSDPLSGSFRYHAIAPITLTAGSEYTLAGTSGGPTDLWTVNNSVDGLSVNPAFTVGPDAARFAYGSEFVNPTSHFSNYLIYAGPNLEGQEAATVTPEPASFLLVACAASALLILRKLHTRKLRTVAQA